MVKYDSSFSVAPHESDHSGNDNPSNNNKRAGFQKNVLTRALRSQVSG
jgi:hypothetical protein